jgi:hypothetical protein|tara:strand:+ start:26 stop:907 length:882 start_codon:yes stop_codon:yes gene_type:complete
MAFNFNNVIKSVATNVTGSNFGVGNIVEQGLNKAIPGDGAVSKIAKSFLGAQANRLINSHLNPGGENSRNTDGIIAASRFGSNNDTRARLALSPASGPILYRDPSNSLLSPLVETDGIVWPYTPNINVSYSAAYTGNQTVHNNYQSQSYGQSTVEQITCVGQFTANTQREAAYLLSVLHFLKSATKSFFGQDTNRGTPPPVLRFSAHGPHMFNSVPVVIANTSQDFEGQIDYINARVAVGDGGIDATTRVPSLININVTLLPVVSRSAQNRFSLAKYARGGLIGKASGEGGMP